MKRTLTASILAMAMTSTMIGTQAKAQGVMVEYNYSCADWSNAQSEDFTMGVAKGWLVGMINGLGLGSNNDFWSTGSGLEPEQAIFWRISTATETHWDMQLKASTSLWRNALVRAG